jgi:hypothetical protein
MGCSGSKSEAQETDMKRTEVGTSLAKAEDVVDFPKFPEGTKSLLCKHLTPQVWRQLKDKKDKYDFTFKQAIFSGCKNTDSGIGVYAGSHDSYTAFAPMMDAIIEDYHGHKKGDKHKSDMTTATLKCPPLEGADAELVVSTRIRVGRNLKDFPLGPAVTREQRNEIMAAVVKACESFEGDLKGKFYSLDSLSEADRQQLIDDHFLFKYVSFVFSFSSFVLNNNFEL